MNRQGDKASRRERRVPCRRRGERTGMELRTVGKPVPQKARAPGLGYQSALRHQGKADQIRVPTLSSCIASELMDEHTIIASA